MIARRIVSSRSESRRTTSSWPRPPVSRNVIERRSWLRTYSARLSGVLLADGDRRERLEDRAQIPHADAFLDEPPENVSQEHERHAAWGRRSGPWPAQTARARRGAAEPRRARGSPTARARSKSSARSRIQADQSFPFGVRRYARGLWRALRGAKGQPDERRAPGEHAPGERVGGPRARRRSARAAAPPSRESRGALRRVSHRGRR